MSFQSQQAKYKRLIAENRAWNLLRTDNAPYILAFIEDIFQEGNEISYGQAQLLLDNEIERSREMGIWDTNTAASSYLNQWIRQGWLREMDDLLTKTDAAEIALRFVRNLDERATNTTASHLRIVQEAVRDFVVALSSNVDDRIALLEQKKAEIQREIDSLEAGEWIELTENERRERIREIYQLSSLLTGDFRHLEEEIRLLDQQLRIQMIADEASRGSVLQSLMEKEALLAETEAGSAFEGFFQLLCDPNRATEFREQLRYLLENAQLTEHLSPNQTRFLSQLMTELNNESQRVFRVRRRTEQELRAYIESGQAVENQAVDKLISQLEKVAVDLCQVENILKTSTTLSLPTGAVSINSPQSMRLKQPDEKLDAITETHENSHQASDIVLNALETVKIRQVAAQIKHALQKQSPQTLGELISRMPINAGLEELVAYIRIAKEVKATELNETENVTIQDRNGITLSVNIPKLLLANSLFPTHLDELSL